MWGAGGPNKTGLFFCLYFPSPYIPNCYSLPLWGLSSSCWRKTTESTASSGTASCSTTHAHSGGRVNRRRGSRVYEQVYLNPVFLAEDMFVSGVVCEQFWLWVLAVITVTMHVFLVASFFHKCFIVAYGCSLKHSILPEHKALLCFLVTLLDFDGSLDNSHTVFRHV